MNHHVCSVCASRLLLTQFPNLALKTRMSSEIVSMQPLVSSLWRCAGGSVSALPTLHRDFNCEVSFSELPVSYL